MLIDCLTVNFAAKKEAKRLKLLEIIALSFRIKSVSKRRKKRFKLSLKSYRPVNAAKFIPYFLISNR